MNDPKLDEIGLHLRTAATRRRIRTRRRMMSLVAASIVVSMMALAAGALRGDEGEAHAARIVERARVATTHIPSDKRTILHVVTRLEHGGENGTMETWQAGDSFRRVGFHPDGSVHAEETLRPLGSGTYEYRAFHKERGGAVIRVARTRDPHAYDIDLIDPAEDLRAAVEAGELVFVGERSFEGEPAFELRLELDRGCGVILPDARVFVRRDTYRPVAVRFGPGLLRFVTIEEVPFDRALLTMRQRPGTPVSRVPAGWGTRDSPCSKPERAAP